MSLLVYGTIALDSVETPYGRRDDAIGGSATYFSLAAAHFTHPMLVGIVGEDFPQSAVDQLTEKGISTAGLEVRKGGKTFRWAGRYEPDMNTRTTLDTQLNVIDGYDPHVPESARHFPFVFLANATPQTQLSIIEQMTEPRFVVADTMNLWIENEREALDALMRRLDGLILNDEEARMLTGELNLIVAGEKILEMGPRIVIVKKGEHGSFLFSNFIKFALPAYPTGTVVDPTGAGDSFAGGFMGYLAGTGSITLWNIKKAMAYGTVSASLNVEAFSVDALVKASRDEIEQRYEEFVQFVSF